MPFLSPGGKEDKHIDELVDKRTQARKNRDWALADSIRDVLNALGVTVIDTPEGTRWTRG